jgi:hypothetical protein
MGSAHQVGGKRRGDSAMAYQLTASNSMGPRQHNQVFHCILDGGPERQAYLDAMARSLAARKELKVAVAEQHRLLFAAMCRCYPALARRVLRA